MLDQEGIPYRYREYRKEPLTEGEIRTVLKALGLSAGELLRKRDAANKELNLTGNESDETLIAHMVQHPTLLQRPIGVYRGRAAIGRPPEKLLELVGDG